MKMNERIIRMLDWPIRQTERLRDWLEEGHHAIYDAPRETTPLGKRCYVMSEKHLSGHRLIVGFDSAADCDAALDFVLAQWKAKAAQWGYVPAGAQPAPSFADAYQGAMEEVAIWKKRALEAEDLNRKFIAEINGPMLMGEPVAKPAPSVLDFANTRDAARYRWLRENGLANEKRESRAVLPRSGKKASMAFRYWTTPEELDMTIDAMLADAPEAKP